MPNLRHVHAHFHDLAAASRTALRSSFYIATPTIVSFATSASTAYARADQHDTAWPSRRYADPEPTAGLYHQGPVGDFGQESNLTSPAEPYTHSLNGVDQAANYMFVNVTVVSFAALMMVVLLYRWVHMGNAHLRHMMTMDRGNPQRYWRYNHHLAWTKIKKYLLYAPLGSVRHNREFQLSSAINVGTIPSRFHTLLLLAYLATNLAYCLDLNYTNKTYEVVAELRGRTGIMAAINLIPTVLFALRNNPLITILGISYDSFNLLHRWCARMMVLQSIVHTSCWASNEIAAGGMRNLNITIKTSSSYQGGLIATVVFSVILITAAGPIRHAFYETFLNAHRLLVLAGIIGVYLHLDRANLPQLPYIQICVLLWMAELFWRITRIVYHNISRRHGITKVTVEAMPAEACRVTFELVRPWRFRPGCHVHAYLPTISWWSSHPFSVAWAETRPRRAPLEIEMDKLPQYSHRNTIGRRASNFDAYSMSSPDLEKRPSVSTIVIPLSGDASSVSLVCRARTGMTKQLYDRARAAPNGVFTTWGAIEGPYGGHETLASYGTVVLFAGGVGITHCVGYVHHLVSRYEAGTSSTRRILLVWSLPTAEALEWIRPWMDQILAMPARRDILRIQLYITKPRSREDHVSNSGTLQMYPGRCNPQTVLEKEMRDRIGAMGVTVCGPGAFADSVRKAVREVTTEGSVDFVEEAFTY